MAFRELAEKIKLPEGASGRYRQLEALGRMLDGTLYDDLEHDFGTEEIPGKSYIPIRERRPSVQFSLAHEITQDTLAELFGDEQFPAISATLERKKVDAAGPELAALVDVFGVADTMTEAYEEGVVGSVAVVIHRDNRGAPFYEVIPAKWCEPVYVDRFSKTLIALPVTYPITAEQAEGLFPGITKQRGNDSDEFFWYRYIIGPWKTVDYRPLPASRFKRLGEPDPLNPNTVIEFVEADVNPHGFVGRVPAIFTKNLTGSQREIDGPALWWPIRDMCVEIDYTLSQAGRGLRYCADPMLFLNRGEINRGTTTPAGYAQPISMQLADENGKPVRGATQVVEAYGPHADAKLLEISADGITEEREYVRDLREYSLEVLGGMKARAEHVKGAPSGRALDKQTRPLRRLVRRQRRPYGNGTLVDLVELTLYGIRVGALKESPEFDISKIPIDARLTVEWPTEDLLQGQDLLYHVQALQAAAGAAPTAPISMIKPEVAGAKLAADIGMHDSYGTIKGDLDAVQDDDPDPEKPSPEDAG